MNFPSDLLYLALQQHLAARVIQVQGFSGNTLQVSRSILQGCRLSVTFTKLYMLRDLIKLREKHPQANISIHVDDTFSDTSTDPLEGGANISSIGHGFRPTSYCKEIKVIHKRSRNGEFGQES